MSQVSSRLQKLQACINTSQYLTSYVSSKVPMGFTDLGTMISISTSSLMAFFHFFV